jgi:predicted phage terminase large subunit-like protein
LVGWFHKDLSARLERFVQQVERQESPRLMIQVPPRHGKSRLASQEFPAWALGHHPEWEVITSSYAVSLPVDFSRNIRERLRDEVFKATFPYTELHPESQSVESWKTTKGGGFLAAGVGGAITGKGAHILIIDDPIKNAEEAESQTVRNAIWNWYTSTAYTRLAPGGGVLIIQTRWHTDDLSGRVEQQMREEDGEEWEIVRYSAIALEDETYRKAGDALHPERYNIEALERIKKAVGPRTWNALYMQNPVPDEGAYFTRSMFQRYEQAPELLEVYNTWDLAVGQKQQNDWSVGLKWGVDANDNIYILDLLRGRFDAAELADHILDMWKSTSRTQACGIEEGQIKLTLGPFLERRVKERRLHSFHQIPLKPGRQDKVARARTIQGRMRQGQVYFPADAPWMDRLMDEMLSFPFGKHDDQVDVLAYCGIMAADVTPPSIESTAVIDTTQKWKKKLLGYVKNGHKARTWLEA